MKSRLQASMFPASWQVIWRSLVDWWDGWFDLLSVVLVWLLAQITIVFGPPATFGLYHVVYNMINGESLGVRGLIDGARKYFGAAWIWNIINLLMLFTLYANIRFYNQFPNDWRYLLQIVFLVLILMWLTGQFYALPFFHEQVEPKVLLALRNGLLMALATPFFSIVLAVFALLIIALSGILVLPVFLGIPAIIPLMGARAVQNRLVAFGIRARDKTPKELEREESGRIQFPGAQHIVDGEREIKK